VRFKETGDGRSSQAALQPEVSLSLLQWETLEVFLNSDRQLLAGEGSVEMLFGAEDSRCFVRWFAGFCDQEEWDSLRSSYALDRFQKLSHIQLLALVVANDQIGFVLLGRLECPVFIRRVRHLVSIADQRLSHRRNGQKVVIDDEDLLRRSFSHINQVLRLEFSLWSAHINIKTCSSGSWIPFFLEI
jgi:hypothetical protein